MGELMLQGEAGGETKILLPHVEAHHHPVLSVGVQQQWC